MQKTYNWGIIGLGKIAHAFAEDLQLLPNARLHAVASRSTDKAQAFAKQFNATHAYGSYADLLDCPDLDAVYIATPHVLHQANALMCLEKGIAVLCEKPIAMNSAQLQRMVATARAQQTFLMEALWTRFLPNLLQSLHWIEEGTLGEVFSVKADFGFKAKFDPEGRLFNPELGGGALLDIGIYPAFLATLLLGEPDEVVAFAKLASTGVDEECSALLRYANGHLANLHCTFRSTTKTEAFIYGEKGTIHIHTRWHEPSTLSLLLHDQRPQFFELEHKGNGYLYEAMEVMQCLEAGKTESDWWSLDHSLKLMKLLDTIRDKAQIKYPMEA